MRIFNFLVVLVLLISSAGSTAGLAEDDPIKGAEAAASKWLGLIDGGRYDESWDAASEMFKKAITKDDWKSAIEKVRQPLGAVKSRKIKTSQYVVNPEGAPEGEYVMIQYDSSFDGLASAVETLTPMKDKDGVWRVSGYYIK
ncbi:MAG: DUF4019 domain-containing protein [Acidobacteriota bacterium]|nr:MAG: DUF4019 domain-containing protein [Acidobacteriota bacterium]